MKLRLAQTGDAAGVRAIYAPVVASSATSFELEPPSVAEIASRIAQRLPLLPWVVAEHKSEIVGYAYASPLAARAAYRWSVDTSVYVAAGHHRQGVGRAVSRALLGVLSAQGYCQAFAGIALPNPGSVALHESLGYQLVGVYRRAGWKLGGWWDVGWWQRELRPDLGAPTNVTALDQLPAPVLRHAFDDEAEFSSP